MDLLPDTHAVLWALYEPERIPKSLAALLEDPASQLFMSEASLWELLDKAAKGRLPLAGTSPEAILENIRSLRIEFVPVTQEDILSAVALSLHHRDPFDRMLVAQAQRRAMLLVTYDADMSRYDLQTLWS